MPLQFLQNSLKRLDVSRIKFRGKELLQHAYEHALMRMPESFQQKAEESVEAMAGWRKRGFKLMAAVGLIRLRYYWLREYVSGVPHGDVVEYVRGEGRMNSRYVFMVSMACAIAVLGLLLSSPAVVIGAMLISPLMGPIMSFGFSLATLDYRQMRRSLIAIVNGIFMALLISYIVVGLSPLNDATPEILARTQPNLFDLLVAIFSGLAGGYAVIKRKGEGIVGVAIATALMPPLAVIGFGLATGSGPIASGAFMLFMTNLLAISLSVSMLARFYGFNSDHSRQHTGLQIAVVLGVFLILSLPLGIALRDISSQAYTTKTAKATIQKYFEAGNSRLSMFNISFSKVDGARIDAVMLTAGYRPNAQKEISARLEEKLGKPIKLVLDQVVVAQDKVDEELEAQAEKNLLAVAAVAAPAAPAAQTDEMTDAISQAVFFPTEFIKIDHEKKQVVIFSKSAHGAELAALHAFEIQLKERHADWDVSVIPAFQALPKLYFTAGATALGLNETEKLKDIVWALKRWGVDHVNVMGYASAQGGSYSRNEAIAYARAAWVAEKLERSGFASKPQSNYQPTRQRAAQTKFGVASFQRAEVQPAESPKMEEIAPDPAQEPEEEAAKEE